MFCFGVLQHRPDVRAAFMKLVEMLKPGGHLAVAVYDARRVPLNARYRVRWLTKRLPKETLYKIIEKAVPLYMKVMPPMHPYNQLVFPLKDHRGKLGMSEAKEIEMCILDTLDSLSPTYDLPQFMGTMKRWCRESNLVEVERGRGSGAAAGVDWPFGGPPTASRSTRDVARYPRPI